MPEFSTTRPNATCAFGSPACAMGRSAPSADTLRRMLKPLSVSPRFHASRSSAGDLLAASMSMAALGAGLGAAGGGPTVGAHAASAIKTQTAAARHGRLLLLRSSVAIGIAHPLPRAE